MNTPIFIHEGLEAATLTASAGSAAGYPTTNLQDRLYDTKWRSNALTANQTFIAQYAASKIFNSAIISNHNFASLGLTALGIHTSVNGSDWVLNDMIETFPDPLYSDFTETLASYVRLIFYKTGNLSVAPEMGILFAGKRIELPLYRSQPQRGIESDADVKTSLNGIRRGVSSCPDRERWNLSFGRKNTLQESEWYRLVRGVNGKQMPFWFYDGDANWHFIRFEKNYMPSKGKANIIYETTEVEISEERTGIEIALPGGYTVPAP